MNSRPKAKEKIRLEEWVYGAGIPDNCPKVKSTKFNAVESAIHSFKKGYPLANIKSELWSSHEWLHFLRHLPKDIDIDDLKKLDIAFSLRIVEQRFKCLDSATIPVGYTQADKQLEEFYISEEGSFEASMNKKPSKSQNLSKSRAKPLRFYQTLDAILVIYLIEEYTFCMHLIL